MSSRSLRKLADKTMSNLALDWSSLVSRIPNASWAISSRTKYTPSTVAKWLQGICKPSGDAVAVLCEQFDEFYDGYLAAIRRNDGALSSVQRRKLIEARKVLEELGAE